MNSEIRPSNSVDPHALSAAAVEASTRHAWRIAAVAAGLLFVCLAAAHWQTVVGLLRLWDTDGYGHGPFVVAASAYLIWRERHSLYKAMPRPSFTGPILLLLISVCWLLVHIMVIRAGRELLFVATIPAIVLSVAGWRTLWILIFPLAYLFFAISAWDVLLHPLQTATAILATDLLQLLGLPVFRETHYIDIPSGQFLVEEACAGLRTFLAGMAVGTLYAYMSFRSIWRWIAFLALTTVWALAINVLRVAITIGSAFPLGMGNFVIHHHGTLGWILFGIGLIPLFAIGHWLSTGERPHSDAAIVNPSTGVARFHIAKMAAIALVAGVAIALAPAFANLYARQNTVNHIHLPSFVQIPGSWHVKAGMTSRWEPFFRRSDGVLKLTYSNTNGKTVWLYTAYYTSERPGSKLIYYANHLYNPKNWQATGSRTVQVDIAGQRLSVREIDLTDRSNTRSRVLWYWYRVAGANTTSAFGAKILRMRSLFSNGAAGVVALLSDVSGNPASTRQALKEVLRGIYPKLTKALDND